MITCKQATKFISQKEEGKLSFRQRYQLWMHLAVCTFCKMFYKQNEVIINNVPHLHDYNDAILSHSEKESIVAALEKN